MKELQEEAFALGGLGLASTIGVLASWARNAAETREFAGRALGSEDERRELLDRAAIGLILTAAAEWHEDHRDVALQRAASVLASLRGARFP